MALVEPLHKYFHVRPHEGTLRPKTYALRACTFPTEDTGRIGTICGRVLRTSPVSNEFCMDLLVPVELDGPLLAKLQ